MVEYLFKMALMQKERGDSMEKIRMMNWLVEIDVNQTRAFYRKDIEICNCLDCENYRQAWKQEDTSVIEIFKTLGIDPTKPRHLSCFGEEQDGLHFYSGNYHIIGKLIEGKYCTDSDWNDPYTIKVKNFTFGFHKKVMCIPEDFPEPVLQLEFENRIPWLLKEEPEN